MAQPELYVIGDSISMYYGPHLERLLQGTIAYGRKTGDEAMQNLDLPVGANGGDSSMVLAFLQEMAKQSAFHPDILMINCGLHDIKTDPQTGAKQVTLDQYRENLRQIVKIVGEIGSRMVWVRTTPVDDERHNARSKSFFRYAVDVAAYNATADEIMQDAGVPIIDLFTFMQQLGGEVFVDHVHHTDHARECQAAFIAGSLCGLLASA